MNNTFDTIVAIATPSGKAALGIIRLSGSDTFSIITKISNLKIKRTKFRKMYPANILYQGNTIDHGMIVLFSAPKSYTGEDMAEIYCHGNTFIITKILEATLQYCRLAEKGEFTLRAFLHQKIDLTQAEAIGNLLEAQTLAAHQAAIKQMEGKLYQKINYLLEQITSLRLICELAIDFGEDEVPDFNPLLLNQKINSLLEELELLSKSANEGIIIQQGLKIALIGPPNVGKSSIFNALLENERAIVTPIPGTTRDYLEESITYQGHLIHLYDTAGLHSSDNQAENLGMEKTKQLLREVDIAFDVSAPDVQLSIDPNLFIPYPNLKIFKILNKIDLLPKDIAADYSKNFTLRCSIKYTHGLDELKEFLVQILSNVNNDLDEGILTNTRQLVAVQKAIPCLCQAQKGIINNLGVEFIAFDLAQASLALEEIIGRISNEDLLNEIFSHFCIGK